MSGLAIQWVDAVGYLASILVFATFYMRTITLGLVQNQGARFGSQADMTTRQLDFRFRAERRSAPEI
jgi:hypothetical protein